MRLHRPAIAAVLLAIASLPQAGAATAILPYGDVDYADPGYQPDGRSRYPIDGAGHIRAAWHYINQPRNAAKYTDLQLVQIRARIIAAWKAKIDPAGPPAARPRP